VDLDEARAFLREHHHGVLATRRADGIMQSPCSSTSTARVGRSSPAAGPPSKVRNLRRDSWAQLCVVTDTFFGRWIVIQGRAQVLSLPEAMDPLIDYHERFPGENPDWDEYRARMRRQHRVLIRIELMRAGPDV